MKSFLPMAILMFSLQSSAAEVIEDLTSITSEELAIQVPKDIGTSAAPIALATKKEADIPVVLENTKKSENAESPLMKMVFSVAILGVLGSASYFLIRKYRFQNPQKAAMEVKVLTQHYLSPKKSLAVVRVAGESILIGVTDHHISHIKTLSLLDEEIPVETPKEFESVFTQKTKGVEIKASSRKTSDSKNSNNDEEAREKDEFSVSGIKEIVSGRLRNMRTLE